MTRTCSTCCRCRLQCRKGCSMSIRILHHRPASGWCFQYSGARHLLPCWENLRLSLGSMVQSSGSQAHFSFWEIFNVPFLLRNQNGTFLIRCTWFALVKPPNLTRLAQSSIPSSRVPRHHGLSAYYTTARSFGLPAPFQVRVRLCLLLPKWCLTLQELMT